MRVRGFREALGLWRGPALAGLTGRTLEAGAARLDEHRLATFESCVDIDSPSAATSVVHAQRGDYREALRQTELSLERYREVGEAVHCYRQALKLYGELGIQYARADTLARLADTHRATGDLAEAQTALREALDIRIAIGHLRIGEIRSTLEELAT